MDSTSGTTKKDARYIMFNKPEGTVTVEILAGSSWRGVKYNSPELFNLTPEYAKHVVETLGVAQYVDLKERGIHVERKRPKPGR